MCFKKRESKRSKAGCSFIKYSAGLLVFFICVSFSNAFSQVILDELPEREGVNVEEHLGEFIPLDLTFTNAQGEEVLLGDYFNKGKPVLLSLAYYDCPMLCTLVLNGVSNGLRKVDWTPGKEFQILTISIDERETPELAAQKKNRYLESLAKKEGENPWEFFVGDGKESKKLADVLGFHYKYDEKTNQFLHPAAVFILTEEGMISRYLYNIDYKPNDLKLGLMEAAKGKFTSTLEKLILYCFHYDPDAKGYVLFAQNVMKLGGALTLILLVILLTSLWIKDRMKHAV